MGNYSSFQGRAELSQRDANGNPVGFRCPGNVSTLKLSLKTDIIEHHESQTGQRAIDLRLVKSKKASVVLTIEEFTRENLALALYGNYINRNAGTVTGETIGGSHPVVSDHYFLNHPKISSVVIKDSALSPATLVEGTGYTLDATFGMVAFLDIIGMTPPFKANYAYGAVTDIGIFTQIPPELYLRFNGVNTARSNSSVIVELYKVSFDPLKDISFISDDLNKFELDGSLLQDDTKPVDAELGQFGRITSL
ncbi:conserved hypothetical protein [Gammaproteobacteria bacterium]